MRVSCWCLCVRIKAVIADILYLSDCRLGRFRSLLRVTEFSPTSVWTVMGATHAEHRDEWLEMGW
jgi:hypothetical protein